MLEVFVNTFTTGKVFNHVIKMCGIYMVADTGAVQAATFVIATLE